MLLLTIDGGGLRAFYSAAILMRIEEEFGINLTEQFSLVAGSSAGGILGTAVGLGYDFGSFLRKLQKGIRATTEPRYPGLTGITSLFAPRLSGEKMESMLNDCFGDKTLGDCKTGLIITTTDVVRGEEHVFSSPYHPSYKRMTDFKLRDVVRATTAAPTYYNPVFLDGKLLADGGLSANSPSLLTFAEAVGKLKTPVEEIKLLALGTGIYSRYNQPEDKDSSWGVFRWGKSLLYVTLQAHASLSDYNLYRLLGDRYLRLELDLDEYYEISDPNNIPLFTRWGKLTFEKNRARLAKFFGVKDKKSSSSVKTITY